MPKSIDTRKVRLEVAAELLKLVAQMRNIAVTQYGTPNDSKAEKLMLEAHDVLLLPR